MVIVDVNLTDNVLIFTKSHMPIKCAIFLSFQEICFRLEEMGRK